jgi:hypothetical protein
MTPGSAAAVNGEMAIRDVDAAVVELDALLCASTARVDEQEA